MADTPEDQDGITEEEAAKKRDDALRRALNTPPKPYKPKVKGKSPKSGSRDQNG